MGINDIDWLENYLESFEEENRKTNPNMVTIWQDLFDEVYIKFCEFLSNTGENLAGHNDVKERIAAMVCGTLLAEYFLKIPTEIDAGLLKFKEFMEEGI